MPEASPDRPRSVHLPAQRLTLAVTRPQSSSLGPGQSVTAPTHWRTARTPESAAVSDPVVNHARHPAPSRRSRPTNNFIHLGYARRLVPLLPFFKATLGAPSAPLTAKIIDVLACTNTIDAQVHLYGRTPTDTAPPPAN